MLYVNILLAISIVVVAKIKAQAFSQSFECFDGNSTLPICTERDKKIIACNNIDPNDQTALVACICNQEWMTQTIQYDPYLLLGVRLTRPDVGTKFEIASSRRSPTETLRSRLTPGIMLATKSCKAQSPPLPTPQHPPLLLENHVVLLQRAAVDGFFQHQLVRAHTQPQAIS